MPMPIRITFRDMPPSEALEAYVHSRAAKLDRFAQRIVDCHVTLEMPHRHQHSGRPFRVAVNLALPGGDVVISHPHDKDPDHQDAHAAIDAAFDQAVRGLEDYVRRQRLDVKQHEEPYRDGRVAKLWSYEGYGFLTTPEGEEIYFHKNSVRHHAFARLKIGATVRFIEEMGDKGPQASTVVLKG